ncbi:peptidyl-prolyl cis-trans isomerase B (cyclophilin B) [Nocardia tenerifensis]|uniref:Peptidyl-prolyl cis-trans isomerase n=1 Tax=Nocardia tenerifensis TaxID=228006 RepID=A0A318JXU6_9NOCA|nr:peptidylprolyl isomerase [Nocardia tenerifensis]PXX59255.1 peptidyl-prolyl cis-trans isomerase B (cyclophilin B) [Nocardia tenerifensis]
MSSEVQGRQFGNSKRGRRFGVPRGVLRAVGVAAVAAALAAFASGGVSASTWSVRTQQPAQCTAPEAGAVTARTDYPAPGAVTEPGATYTAKLETSCGAIDIALDPRAPQTVNSFAFLAGEQYFNHTKCHRITTGGIFVLQCGDPTATGTGGPGYRIADENLAGATYPAGTVAMANAGPNTNGSQFFLVYQDSPLPPSYTPFGRITAGLDVLQAVAAAGTKDGSPDGAPRNDVVLNKVETVKN